MNDIELIAALRESLRNAYTQEVYEGSGWIKWRYMSGFDTANEETKQKMARGKAEGWMRGDGLL